MAQLATPLLSFQQPAVLPAMLLISIVPARRFGRATGRALTMVIGFTILLHLLAWLAYGPVQAVHAACALVGLAVLIPIAVRSRRTYPLVVGAAALLSALALMAASLESGGRLDAAEALAALANLIMATALWSGLTLDWLGRPKSGEHSARRTV